MVAKGSQLPNRIEPDAILEALIDFRFDLVAPLPEILMGRLTELDDWKTFKARRLPAYDFPAALRDADANLRFMPILELSSEDSKQIVRISSHSLAYHSIAPYPGWQQFQRNIFVAVDGLFAKTQGLVINRLGLRFLNALTEAKHGIRTVRDLDVNIVVSEEMVGGRLLLSFATDMSEDTQCTVKVATSDQVQGAAFPAGGILIDVDVYTSQAFRTDSIDEVKRWIAASQIHKNAAFYGLLSQETINRLGRD